jgi:hypothetical protein
MSKTKNVFISHYHKNDPQLQSLKDRFAQKGYSLRNSSIDSTKHGTEKRPSDAVVKRLLRMRINWAGTFICLIGDRTHTRPWVNYEIEQAAKMGKHIIGIYAHGSKGSADIPDELKDCGEQLFGWNSVDKIIDAIENNNQYQWENPDGSPSVPIYNLKTVSC